jgi:hypothetical protein
VNVRPFGLYSVPTWLYTRGPESVRIEVHEHGLTLSLLVHGPGSRRRIVECDDRWALIERQIAEEARLLALGYTLERCTSARRGPAARRRRGQAGSGKILRHRERSRT